MAAEFRTAEEVIDDLRMLADSVQAIAELAEAKINELVQTIDRQKRGGGELPEAGNPSQHSS